MIDLKEGRTITVARLSGNFNLFLYFGVAKLCILFYLSKNTM